MRFSYRKTGNATQRSPESGVEHLPAGLGCHLGRKTGQQAAERLDPSALQSIGEQADGQGDEPDRGYLGDVKPREPPSLLYGLYVAPLGRGWRISSTARASRAQAGRACAIPSAPHPPPSCLGGGSSLAASKHDATHPSPAHRRKGYSPTFREGEFFEVRGMGVLQSWTDEACWHTQSVPWSQNLRQPTPTIPPMLSKNSNR